MLNSSGLEGAPVSESRSVRTQIGNTINSLKEVSREKGIQGLSPLISSSRILRSRLSFADQECIERAKNLFEDQGPVHNFLRGVIEEGIVQEWQVIGVTSQVDALSNEIEQSPTYQEFLLLHEKFILRGQY